MFQRLEAAGANERESIRAEVFVMLQCASRDSYFFRRGVS